jgi:hypothetical protein
VKKKNNENKMPLQVTSGFMKAGVYARRNICANFQVHRPPEHLCPPRLHKAATTLPASGGQRSRKRTENLKISEKIENNEIQRKI